MEWGWETTGGPQQFGAAKNVVRTTRVFYSGICTRNGAVYFKAVAPAGFKGLGLWSWSVRSAGAEVGEYALLDHHNGNYRQGHCCG